MKKLIFGISMFLGGIVGIVGIVLATAIESEGFGNQGLTNCISYAGMMPYFIIFAFLSVIGIRVAYEGAYKS